MPREKPLHMVRVPSVFAALKSPTSVPSATIGQDSASKEMEEEETAEKEEEEEEEEEEGEGEESIDVSFVEPILENVMLDVSSNPRSKYYEQFCIDEDCFRTGKGEIRALGTGTGSHRLWDWYRVT